MEAITTKVVQSLDGLKKSMKNGRDKQEGVNTAMAAAMYQMGNLVKSQSRVIDELGSRLGMVERQPAAAPKGVQNPAQAAALSKGMPGEAGDNGGGVGQLNKSEMASALSYMRFEKGMDAINGEPIGQLAAFAESGGDISKSVCEYMDKWLATHPQERAQALQYH
jgi:hypothetical protein